MISNRNEYKLFCINSIYFSFLIIYVFLYAIKPLDSLMGLIIWRIINYSFGFFAIFYNFFIHKSYKQVKYYPFILLFFSAYVVTIIVNSPLGYIRSIQEFYYMLIFMIVVLSLGGQNESKYIRRQYILYSSIIVIIWTLAVIWSLWMFVTGYSGSITLSNRVAIQGFYESRLWGVFDDPNYASVNSVAILWISLSLLRLKRSKNGNLLLKFSIVIQFLYIILSNSRISKLTFFITAMLAIWFKEKERFGVKRTGPKVLLWSAIGIVLIVGAWNTCVAYIPLITTQIQEYNSTTSRHNSYTNASYTQPETISLERIDANNADISNHRFTIWKSVLEVFPNHALWGTSFYYMADAVRQSNPDTYIAQRGYSPHNGYLDILLSSGIAGFLPMMSFFIFTILYLLYKIWQMPIKEKYNYILMILIPIGMALGYMTLSGLCYSNTSTGLLFWLYTGFTLKGVKKQFIQSEVAYEL